MGWDAHSSYADGREIQIDWKGHRHGTEPELKDQALKAAFAAAADRVRQEGHSVDWLLPLAGLDVSTCGQALADATGRSVYSEEGWSADTVRDLAARAAWPEEPAPDTAWAVACARAFLETCAANNLSIGFSW